MTTRSKQRQLNTAFAAAHGISGPSRNTAFLEESSSKRAEISVRHARFSGKLNAANAGLSSPLPDILFDLRHGIEVDLSMDTSAMSTWESHAEETLKLVDFSDNNIGILDDRILCYQSLSIFRLKRCNLTALPMESLSCLRKLTILDLASNQLEKFYVGMLPTSIRELDLSSNKLRSLLESGGETAVNLPNLVKLNVSHNCLERIPESLNCPRLQSFDCEHNRISEIPAGFLDSASQSLSTLQVRHNCITACPNLTVFQQLRIVDLSENKLTRPPTLNLLLTRIMISDNELNSLHDLFENDNSMDPSELVELHVCNNKLVELDRNVAERLLHMKLLDIRNNDISSLPPVLGYLPNARQVLLDGNPLRTLGSVDRGDTRALQSLLRKRGPPPPGNGYLPQEIVRQANSTHPVSLRASGIDLISSALVGTKIFEFGRETANGITWSLYGAVEMFQRGKTNRYCEAWQKQH